MSYWKIEQAIVARLKKTFEPVGFVVENTPETEAEFKRNIERPRVSVGFVSSEYDKPGNNVYSQTETICFAIVMRAKRLREKEGMYELILAVRNSLLGFRPTNNVQQLYLCDTELVQHEDNTWMYSLTAKCKTVALGVENEEINFKLDASKLEFIPSDENTPSP
jgi:hypothetical protein